MSLLDDEWVAISNFPKEIPSSTYHQHGESDFPIIQSSWDKDNEILSISYCPPSVLKKQDDKVKYEASFKIDTISAIDLQLRSLISNLDDVPFPKLPMEYPGM